MIVECISIYLALFKMFTYFWKGERQSASGGEAKRGRHRIWSRLQFLSCQHRTWRRAQIHKPQDHDLSQVWTLNQLSHLYNSFIYLVKFIPKYFIFSVVVNKIAFCISYSWLASLIYRNKIVYIHCISCILHELTYYF